MPTLKLTIKINDYSYTIQPTNWDDVALEVLCDELNKTEIIYLQTNIKVV